MLCFGSYTDGVRKSFYVSRKPVLRRYGEEDRNSLLALTKYALKSGVILSAVAMAVIITSSYYISDIFFDVNDEAFAISMRMLLLFPSFLIFNTIFACS